MDRYRYEGPVMEFGRCIADNWTAETLAVSESKARSNFVYQFKSKFNRAANSRITLPGKIVLVH